MSRMLMAIACLCCAFGSQQNEVKIPDWIMSERAGVIPDVQPHVQPPAPTYDDLTRLQRAVLNDQAVQGERTAQLPAEITREDVVQLAQRPTITRVDAPVVQCPPGGCPPSNETEGPEANASNAETVGPTIVYQAPGYYGAGSWGSAPSNGCWGSGWRNGAAFSHGYTYYGPTYGSTGWSTTFSPPFRGGVIYSCGGLTTSDVVYRPAPVRTFLRRCVACCICP